MATAFALVLTEIVTAFIDFDFSRLLLEANLLAGIALFILPAGVLVPITLIIHFRTQLRTLTFAANVISREKRGGTWDLLLLARIDTRQIILGKWWATQRHMWRSYLLLALLRAGSILWIALEADRLSYNFYPALQFEIQPRYFSPSALHILLSLLVIVSFTFVNMAYTAAFGTLASMIARGNGSSLAMAIVVRTGVLIASAIILGLIGYLVWLIWRGEPGDPPAQVFYFFLQAGVTLFDNGALVSIVLSYYNPAYLNTGAYIASGILALGICGLFTWLALRIAQSLAIRQGALPPAESIG